MSDLRRLHHELGELCQVLMPAEARAATLEIVRWLVSSRVYLHGPGSMERWEELDATFTPLIEARLPAEQRREVIVKATRRDRPEPLDVFGSVVWIERGTQLASQDGRAPGSE